MDKVDKETRSIIMSKIRSKGNRSTELKMRMLLVRKGISGWQIHPRNTHGNPDFVFPELRLAIFVDGCFWHGCPRCGHLPKTNTKYWDTKLKRNIERDTRQRSLLSQIGWKVMRVWEHEFESPEKIAANIKAAIKVMQE